MFVLFRYPGRASKEAGITRTNRTQMNTVPHCFVFVILWLLSSLVFRLPFLINFLLRENLADLADCCNQLPLDTA